MVLLEAQCPNSCMGGVQLGPIGLDRPRVGAVGGWWAGPAPNHGGGAIRGRAGWGRGRRLLAGPTPWSNSS